MRWVSRLITFVVIVAGAAGLLVFIRGRLPKTTVGQQFTTYAKFRDASKLVVGSPIVIAGVRIGEVTELAIEGRFARVDMRLRDDTQIGVDSLVTKRAPSTFGDSYLEILPSGGAAEGATNERLLASGEPLTHVIESSSTDSVLRATERSMPQLEQGLNALSSFMSNGRTVVNGTVVESLTTMSEWLDQGNLQAPLAKTNQALDSIEAATAKATNVLGANGNPDEAVAARLARFDDKITKLRTSMVDIRKQVNDGLADTRGSLDAFDDQIAKVQAYTSAINEGRGDDWKGKLGRLVNDPHPADDLEDATASLKDGTASLDRFKAYLGARIELNALSRLTRTYVTAEIRARDDKFYLLELEKGLLGGPPNDAIGDAVGATGYTRTVGIADKLRFSAMIGRSWGPLRLRAGMKENAAGVGADWLAGRLELSADLFGTSFSRAPDLKLAAAVMVFKSVYLVGGIDDALTKGGSLSIVGSSGVPSELDRMRYGRDYFLGAMLRFDDQDITALLRVYGALLAAAAI